MSSVTIPPPGNHVSGSGGNGAGSWEGGEGGGGGGPRRLPPAVHRLGMGLGLASIAMLFVAMTSAYIVRHAAGSDWRPIRMPQFLLLNTFILIVSSYTMEKARRAFLQGRPGQLWLRVTFLLGVLFIGGQILVWRGLSEAGIYLGSNPHSSFFYLLTALHGAHLLGGIVVLGFLSLGSSPQYGFAGAAGVARTVVRPVLRLDRWVDATALYWHFMDGLWLYLVVLLFVRR